MRQNKRFCFFGNHVRQFVQVKVIRAKRAVRVALASIQDGAYSFLSYLNEYLAGGDWTRSITIPEAIEKVSVSDVERVAQRYFVEDQGTVGWFVGIPQSKKPAFKRSQKK